MPNDGTYTVEISAEDYARIIASLNSSDAIYAGAICNERLPEAERAAWREGLSTIRRLAASLHAQVRDQGGFEI
jgi:hypothetical protein